VEFAAFGCMDGVSGRGAVDSRMGDALEQSLAARQQRRTSAPAVAKPAAAPVDAARRRNSFHFSSERSATFSTTEFKPAPVKRSAVPKRVPGAETRRNSFHFAGGASALVQAEFKPAAATKTASTGTISRSTAGVAGAEGRRNSFHFSGARSTLFKDQEFKPVALRPSASASVAGALANKAKAPDAGTRHNTFRYGRSVPLIDNSMFAPCENEDTLRPTAFGGGGEQRGTRCDATARRNSFHFAGARGGEYCVRSDDVYRAVPAALRRQTKTKAAKAAKGRPSAPQRPANACAENKPAWCCGGGGVKARAVLKENIYAEPPARLTDKKGGRRADRDRAGNKRQGKVKGKGASLQQALAERDANSGADGAGAGTQSRAAKRQQQREEAPFDNEPQRPDVAQY
jgi:hypothetical protein